jgi:hypothetical protein
MNPNRPLSNFQSAVYQYTYNAKKASGVCLQNVTDYSPFGVTLDGRTMQRDGYRYGFNGIEKADEISGKGNHYTALFGEYDSRLGRRWNQDPKPNPSISNYAVFANNPIWYSDVLLDTIGVNWLRTDASLKNAGNNIKNQVNDGVFAVFAHANSQGIQYEVNGNNFLAKTVEEFNTAMSQESKEWQTAMKDGTKITLVIYACNAASNEYYDNHFTNKVIKSDVTIAQKISTFLSDKNENSLVVAGDGYGVFSGGDNKFIGFRQSESKDVINNKKGGFVTIKDGKKIYKKQHAYTGASTPKKGDKKKYE